MPALSALVRSPFASRFVPPSLPRSRLPIISGDVTTEPMHPNLARVVDAATRAGHEIAPQRFPEGTRTAADAARAVGCEIGQIVKSLVFVADGEPLLALVSGTNRADTAKLATAVGAN